MHQLFWTGEPPSPLSRENTGYFGLPNLPTPFPDLAAAGIQSGGSGPLFDGEWNSSKKKNVRRLCIHKTISTPLRARPTESPSSIFHFLLCGMGTVPHSWGAPACSPEGLDQAPPAWSTLMFMQEHRIQRKQHNSNAAHAGAHVYEYLFYNPR